MPRDWAQSYQIEGKTAGVTTKNTEHKITKE